MKLLFAFLVVSLGGAGPLSLVAQTPRPPRIEWQRTVGGASYDAPSEFVETSDGSFVFGGLSLSGVSGNKSSPSWDTNAIYGGDFWLIKLDSTGQILWDRSFGGSDWDGLVDLQQTFDGGFVLAGPSLFSTGGNKTSPAYGADDMWLVRTDANGNKLWDQSLGGVRYDFYKDMEQTLEGGFLVTGGSSSPPSGNKSSRLLGPTSDPFSLDAWVAMLDSTGKKLWDYSFGGSYSEQFYRVTRTVDGGFLLTGKSDSDQSGNKTSPYFGFDDFWAVRIDSSGHKIWEQSYGGSGFEFLDQTIALPDGGFLLAGDSTSYADGNKTSPPLGPFDPDAWPFAGPDIWIVRIDSEGRKLWDRSVGSAKPDGLSRIQATRDGGVIVVGRSVDSSLGWWGPLEQFAVRLDPAGNELWRHSFGTNASLFNVLEMPDGGFILGGGSGFGTNRLKSNPGFGSGDCWLVRFDFSGNKLWDLSLGGSGEDYLSTIAQTKEGGFILGIASASATGGNKTTPGYGDYDLWAIKLSPELPDSDGDGVPDELDQCPKSLTGVVVNATGCSIEQIVPCDSPWKNHGEYVSAIAQASTQFRKAGLISREQQMAIFSQAVKSDCGKRLAESATRPLTGGRR